MASGRDPAKALRPGRLRELVTGMCVDWGVSIRRACGAICFDTSSDLYKSRRTDQAAVERRIKEIAETRVRYGYRRVHVLLRREGWVINMKKTRRIYNELGLQLRNKHPKRRVKAKLREDRQEAIGPNDVWAMGFVHDQLALGKKLRILTVVDTHSRLCPAADPRFTYRGADVVQTLERVCGHSRSPRRCGCAKPLLRPETRLWPHAALFGGCARGHNLKTVLLPDVLRQRVHLSRPRSLGLCQRRHAGLLTAGKADRQRVHLASGQTVPRTVC